MVLEFAGERINRIEAQREELLERPMSISTSPPTITDVSKKEIYAAGEQKKGLAISYDFEIKYGEKSGKILINSTLVSVGSDKEMDEIEKEWKKNKQMKSNMAIPLLNHMMELSYLTAIPLAKELGLPTPIKMPRFVKSETKKEETEEPTASAE